MVLVLLPVRPLTPLAAVVALRVLKLEEDRCRLEGVGWLAPERRWFALWSFKSGKPVEVEDVVDATDADCCRRSDSSLVRRLT